MTAKVLDAPVRFWNCPSCGLVDRTQRSDVHTQFHPCKSLFNANVPMIEVSSATAKADGRNVLMLREDYARDPSIGRFASVRTERGDGSNDCTVFAPIARVYFTGSNANQ